MGRRDQRRARDERREGPALGDRRVSCCLVPPTRRSLALPKNYLSIVCRRTLSEMDLGLEVIRGERIRFYGALSCAGC